MKTGDQPAHPPPVIPAGLREASGFLERGSATRSASKNREHSVISISRTGHTQSPSEGLRGILGFRVFGILALAFVAACVLYRFNPSLYSFYPRCLFNAVTGLLCPGCGSQRAMYQLIHGHPLIACRCNLPLMLALPWFTIQSARYAMAEWRGTSLPQWLPHPRWWKWIVTAMVLFAVLRNFPGAPFCYLAPP